MSLLFILVLILMVAVLLVMLLGIVNMARGGEQTGTRSNKLMVWRVGLQAAALAGLALLFLLGKSAAH